MAFRFGLLWFVESFVRRSSSWRFADLFQVETAAGVTAVGQRQVRSLTTVKTALD